MNLQRAAAQFGLKINPQVSQDDEIDKPTYLYIERIHLNDIYDILVKTGHLFEKALKQTKGSLMMGLETHQHLF